MCARFIGLDSEFGRCRTQAIKKLPYICNPDDFDSLMSYLRFLKGRLNDWEIPSMQGQEDDPLEAATNQTVYVINNDHP